MGSWWQVLDQSDDPFVGSDEGLDVCLGVVCCAPYWEFPNEVWEDLAAVELLHRVGWEKFVGVSEALDDRL